MAGKNQESHQGLPIPSGEKPVGHVRITPQEVTTVLEQMMGNEGLRGIFDTYSSPKDAADDLTALTQTTSDSYDGLLVPTPGADYMDAQTSLRDRNDTTQLIAAWTNDLHTG